MAVPRVLLTTTSYQDTPGSHHDLLASAGFEVIRERGPLSEQRILELVGEIDGLLCGDDGITRQVIEKALPRLKVISKYGIGLDKIDLKAATDLKVPVTFCPGVNHTTVAEHTFGLLIAACRNIVTECGYVKSGQWKRITGHELRDKTIGIIGLGRIGKEVAIRARAFGMSVLGYGNYWDDDFAAQHQIRRAQSHDEIFREADVISLHTKLTDQTRRLIDARAIAMMKNDAVVVNCARGELVDPAAMVEALDSGRLYAYAADVLEEEPPPADHPYFACKNTVLTPHIGSRTYENVVRQATMATENLIAVLKGEKPLAQANDV
jgi:D-3-phosphoglycerate dehydrogenase